MTAHDFFGKQQRLQRPALGQAPSLHPLQSMKREQNRGRPIANPNIIDATALVLALPGNRQPRYHPHLFASFRFHPRACIEGVTRDW